MISNVLLSVELNYIVGLIMQNNNSFARAPRAVTARLRRENA